MRVLSFDDSVPGVIAIGGAPIGILAIGGMPVGVVAIGFGAIGGVAVSCGGAAGIVAISCGVGVGGYAGTVGLGFGLRASSVGGELSVIPDDDDPYPRARPAPPTLFEIESRSAVDLEDIGESVPSGWARVRPTRGSATEAWRITVGGETVTVEPYAATTLHTWDGDDDHVLAHAIAETAAPAGESAGYRDAAPVRHVLRVDKILLPEPRTVLPENESLFGRRLWWLTKVGVKGLGLLGCVLAALFIVRVRFSELDMTRTTSTEWSGTLRRAEGMVFPSDTKCTVKSAMRSDGKENTSVRVEITCGSLVLYPGHRPSCELTESAVAGSPGHYSYALRCNDRGEDASDDHPARPSLVLDTAAGSATLDQKLPHPFHVEIAVDPHGSETIGEPLFLSNRPDAQAAPPGDSATPSPPSTPSTPSSFR